MRFDRYISILLALALCCAGCSSDTGSEPVPSTPLCELVVTLDAGYVPAGKVASRAGGDTWGDPYPEEYGIPEERAIADVSLYLIARDGSVVALVPSASGSSDGKYVYRAKVNVNSAYVDRDGEGRASISGRIVALANYPGVAPANPLAAPPYAIDAVRTEGLIPMWGVTTLSSLPLRPDHTTDAGRIDMLRSVPKITIEMEEKLADLYKITAVRPDEPEGFIDMAYCQPAGASGAAATSGLLIEDCFNPAGMGGKSVAPHFYGLGTSRVWCYPAERVCSPSDGRPVAFTVTLERKDGTAAPFTGKVYLCDYNGGSPVFGTAFDQLVRNHDYQYRISLTELEFIISFRKWIFGGKVHLELE